MLSVMEGFAVAVNGTAAANFPLTICSSANYWFVPAATARAQERCVVMGDRRFLYWDGVIRSDTGDSWKGVGRH